MPTTITIANLRERRLAAGVSQIELAQQAGCALNTVRNAEGGLRVTEHTAERLVGALTGLDPDDA